MSTAAAGLGCRSRWSGGTGILASSLLVAVALAVLAVAAEVWAQPGPSQAPVALPKDSTLIEALAPLLSVSPDGQAAIALGSDHGLEIRDRDSTVYRPSPRQNGVSSEEVAWARIVERGRQQSKVLVRGACDPLQPGLVVSLRLRVPAWAADEPLMRALALGFVPLGVTDRRPLTSLATLLAQNAAAAQGAVTRLTSESRSVADQARAMNKAVVRGRYLGQSLGQAMAATEDADTRECLRYVVANPERYANSSYAWAEIYATWLLFADDDQAVRRHTDAVAALEQQADAASSSERFGEATALWQRLLALEPEQQRAKKALAALAWRSNLLAQLAEAPRDRDLRWSLSVALIDLGAYAAARQVLETLVADDAEDTVAANKLAQLAWWQRRVAEAEARWRDLAHRTGKATFAKSADLMRQWLHTTAHNQDSPSCLALANAFVDHQMWSDASAWYGEARRFSTSAAATALACQGQERVDRAVRATERAQQGRQAVDEFAVVAVEAAFDDTVKLLADRPAVAAELLRPVADAARDKRLLHLAERLAERLVAMDPTNVEMWNTLALTQGRLRKPTQELKTLLQAQEIDDFGGMAALGQFTAYMRLGQLAKAREAARRLIQKAGGDAIGHILAAKVAVAEARYAEAAQHTAKAWARVSFEPDDKHIALADRAEVEAAIDAGTQLRSLSPRQLATPQGRRLTRQLGIALAELGAFDAASKVLEQLPSGSAERRELAGALASDDTTPPDMALAYCEQAQDGSAVRQRQLQRMRAEAAALRHPDDLGLQLRWAQLLILDGQFLLARGVCAQALARADRTGDLAVNLSQVAKLADDGLAADARLAQSRAASVVDNDEQGESEAVAALAVFQRLGAPARAGDAALRAASAAAAHGEELRAVALAQQAVAIAKNEGDPADVLRAEEVLAHIRALLGALDAWAPAIEALERRCLDRGRVTCLAGTRLRLAQGARQQGRLAQALAYARQSRRNAELGGEPHLFRKALDEELSILMAAEDLPEAVTVATQLFEMARAGGEGHQERAALTRLAAVAWRLGDDRLAADRFAAALASAHDAEPAQVPWIRLERAQWWLDGHAGEQAVQWAQKAADEMAEVAQAYRARSSDTSRIEAEALQARALLAAGQPSEARRVAARVEADALARSAFEDALTAAWVRARSEPVAAQAVAAGERAVALANRLELPGWRSLALHALGQAHLRAGDAAKGRKWLLQAVDQAAEQAVMAVGAASPVLRREREQVFADAVQALLAAGAQDQALQVLAVARAVQARNNRALAGVQAGDAEAQAALQAYVSARQQQHAARAAASHSSGKGAATAEQSAWKARAEAKTRETQSQLQTIRAHYKRLWPQVAVEPESLPALLKRLPDKTLILQYFALPDRLVLFVVGPGGIQTREVPVAWPEVERAVEAWRRLAVDDGRRLAAANGSRGAEALGDLPAASTATVAADQSREQQLQTVGLKLYGWLLQPVQAEIAAANTVLVVPFSLLHYLPLHALPHRTPRGEIRYVIEDVRMGYLSAATATALADRRARTPRSLRVLGIGNPDGTLPGAHAELQQARQFIASDSVLLFGKEGTVAQFTSLAKDFDVLHLATHGVLQADPSRSYLRMADGPLTLSAISATDGLALRPRLAVLSACSTLLQRAAEPGVAVVGDEIASLATAFAVAGVPTLVATLWDVDDQATAALMASFYRHLAAGADTLEALRQAQLALLAAGRNGMGRPAFASPAAWGAVELVGDPR